MATELRLNVSGTPADDGLRSALQLSRSRRTPTCPTTMLIRLPVNRTSDGDLDYVSDGSFDPMTNLGVVLTMEDGSAHCVFDGYVLSWRLHLDRTVEHLDDRRLGAGRVVADGHRREGPRVGRDDRRRGRERDLRRVRVHVRPTANTDDDSPPHDRRRAHADAARDRPAVPARPGPAQRQAAAVSRAPTRPASAPATSSGPTSTADPSATLDALDPETWNSRRARLRVGRAPPDGRAGRARSTSHPAPSDGVAGNASDSGLAALGERDYATYAGQTVDRAADAVGRRRRAARCVPARRCARRSGSSAARARRRRTTSARSCVSATS